MTAFVRIDHGGQAALFTLLGEYPGRPVLTPIESLASRLMLAVAPCADLNDLLPAFAVRCEADDGGVLAPYG